MATDEHRARETKSNLNFGAVVGRRLFAVSRGYRMPGDCVSCQSTAMAAIANAFQ